MQAVSEGTSRGSRLLAVSSLASLPLFQLSTAGMELFHTNMLYWLASERPDESVAVWNALGILTARIDQQSAFVRREWHHIDLVVAPGDGQPALVVENKIGAIPTPGQLDRYHAELRSARPPFDPESAEYVLLTLTPPSFALPVPWRSVTYRELLPALQETARNLAESDASLVAAYAKTVARLDEVAAAYDPVVDLDAPFALSPDERGLLNESRLLPLVEKVRVGRFAEIATNLLTTELGEVGPVVSGFSNGSANYDWFIPVPAGRLIGWQIQGGTFRLAVIAGKGDPHVKAGLEALVAELYGSYFDFTLPDHLGHVLSRYRGKKQWLGYKPSFVYRYEELTPQITWRDLLDLVTWFSRHALRFAAGLRGGPHL
jgi:hypothetical protein